MSSRLEDAIRSAVHALFGDPKRLDRPGLIQRYTLIAEGASDASIRDALGRCADKSPYLPTPNVFREQLAIVRQDAGEVVEHYHHPEKSEECPVCGTALRYFMVEEQWVPFANNGGLMFRELDGQVLAMRCWECRGPKWLRAVLPIPHITQMAHYKPARYVPQLVEAEAQAVNAVRAFFDHQHSWARAGECANNWQSSIIAAIENTLRALAGKTNA